MTLIPNLLWKWRAVLNCNCHNWLPPIYVALLTKSANNQNLFATSHQHVTKVLSNVFMAKLAFYPVPTWFTGTTTFLRSPLPPSSVLPICSFTKRSTDECAKWCKIAQSPRDMEIMQSSVFIRKWRNVDAVSQSHRHVSGIMLLSDVFCIPSAQLFIVWYLNGFFISFFTL